MADEIKQVEVKQPTVVVKAANPTTGEQKEVALDSTSSVFVDSQGQNNYSTVVSAFSDGEYTQEEQESYNTYIQAEIDRQLGAGYTMSEFQYVEDVNELTEIEPTSEVDANNNQEEVDETKTADEPPEEASQSKQNAKDYFESDEFKNKSPEDQEKEKTKILTALFGQKFKDAGYTDEQIAEQIKQMKPTDNFWNAVKYDAKSGNTSLNIDPFDAKGETPKLDGPWRFMNELYGGRAWAETKGIFNVISAGQEFKWGKDVVFSGSANSIEAIKTAEASATNASETVAEGNNGAVESQKSAEGENSSNAPVGSASGTQTPPNDKEVDLTLSLDESGNLKIGDHVINVDENGLITAQDENNYSGFISDGTYITATTNPETGAVTVSYYDGAPAKEGTTPANKTVTYNKDGSTVEKKTDDDKNITTTSTSADGQTTTVVTDSEGNPTSVSMGNEHYATDGSGNWYQVDENGKPVDANADGFPDVRLSNPPQVGTDGSITIATGTEENPCSRIYNPNGSLASVTVNGKTYDMSGYKCIPQSNGGLMFDKITSSDGENKERVWIMPDGSIETRKFEDGAWNGSKYDINGNLIAIDPIGGSDKWISVDDLTQNENGNYVDADGNTYIKNDDGTYSVQKSNKPKIDDNKLIIGDAEIQFGENGLEINDDGTYSGMTADGYAVVKTDGNGNTSVEYYADKATYEAYKNGEEGAQGPNKTTKWNEDGSKSEYKTSTQEIDGVTKTTTTATTTAPNGETTIIEIIETTDTEGVKSTEETRTAADGSKVKITTSQVDGETVTKVKIDDGEEVVVPYVQQSGDKYEEISYNPETGEINHMTADTDASGNVASYTTLTYGTDGALAKMVVNGQTYNMGDYKKNANGSYTKYVTSDGGITQKIVINAEGGVSITSTDGNQSNTAEYNKYGKMTSATIDGKTYKVNADGKAVDGSGNVVGEIKVDQYGRYYIETESQEPTESESEQV
ncbi:MAG: hypothetical protein IJW73_01280 [Candidatus Gastranaerophilales bacterium]|nr:hypothetical protein [Candidatus Gastranaerophilales bacterium]